MTHEPWKDPEYDGGSAVNNYIVDMRELGDKAEWVTLSQKNARCIDKVNKLKRGGEYQFRIVAENRFGRSDPIIVPDLADLRSLLILSTPEISSILRLMSK